MMLKAVSWEAQVDKTVWAAHHQKASDDSDNHEDTGNQD